MEYFGANCGCPVPVGAGRGAENAVCSSVLAEDLPRRRQKRLAKLSDDLLRKEQQLAGSIGWFKRAYEAAAGMSPSFSLLLLC